jgi:hypothetical protein
MLREQWHENGVVISLRQAAGAMAQSSGYEQVVLLARRRGPGRAHHGASTRRAYPDLAAKTMALVKQLFHEGPLTPARLDES